MLQKYGHTSEVCNFIPQCVKCSGDHLSKNCTHKGRPHLCKLWGGEAPTLLHAFQPHKEHSLLLLILLQLKIYPFLYLLKLLTLLVPITCLSPLKLILLTHTSPPPPFSVAIDWEKFNCYLTNFNIIFPDINCNNDIDDAVVNLENVKKKNAKKYATSYKFKNSTSYYPFSCLLNQHNLWRLYQSSRDPTLKT